MNKARRPFQSAVLPSTGKPGSVNATDVVMG